MYVIVTFALSDILILRIQRGYLGSDAEGVLEAIVAVAGFPNLGKVLPAVTPFKDNITSVIEHKYT